MKYNEVILIPYFIYQVSYRDYYALIGSDYFSKNTIHNQTYDRKGLSTDEKNDLH